jgi:Arc/MetJ family transcription regulator
MSRRPEIRRIEVVDEAVAEVLRRKTLTERVAMTLACNRTVRLRIEGHLRTLHPDWDGQAIAREVARRMLLGTT